MTTTTAPRFNLFWFSSPQTFYPLAGRLIPWFIALAVILTLIGLYISFVVAPTDATQGESYRIIFIHVPAAWMSMFLYVVMAFWAAMGLAFNTRLSSMMATAIAPTGALMTFLALWTGALWGRPTWGAYWVWDARLTSELILLFLYLGFIALQAAIDDPAPCRQGRSGAGDRRRHQRADHLLLGEVVEHAAPGCLGERQGLVDGHDDVVGNAHHGARLLDVLYRRRSVPGAHDHPRTGEARRLGPGTCSARETQVTWGSWDAFWSMGGYGLYVWGSYAMVVAVVAIEIWQLRVASPRRR